MISTAIRSHRQNSCSVEFGDDAVDLSLAETTFARDRGDLRPAQAIVVGPIGQREQHEQLAPGILRFAPHLIHDVDRHGGLFASGVDPAMESGPWNYDISPKSQEWDLAGGDQSPNGSIPASSDPSGLGNFVSYAIIVRLNLWHVDLLEQ